jgi:Flp pilus assembly secretin CpaC
MKRYQLCLSLSLAIAQSAALTARAEDSAIWKKLSGASEKPTTEKAASKAAAKPHSMLVLNGSSKGVSDIQSSPAAIAIHKELSDLALAPDAVDSGLRITSKGISAGSSKRLLAQLAPDAIVAQGGGTDNIGGVTTSPIPPVVSGTVDMEEFKPSNIIDLKVSQSRTFKSKNKIVRTSISDPSIAEPVVVAENQMVLLGKTPGICTMVLWDDAGNSAAIDLRVTRDYSQLQSTLREIDPRIVVKAYNVGGTDRVILLGDVDYPESVIRAFAAANIFMDDRGINIDVANNRLIKARIGEQSGGGGGGGAGGGGGGGGQFATLGSVDKYTYFPNLSNNISRGQLMSSDGGRVTSMVKIRKVPLIVLHVTFMEMNTATARQIGIQLGINIQTATSAYGIGGLGYQSTPAGFEIPVSYGGYQINGVNSQSSGFQPPGFVSVTNQTFPLAATAGLTQAITGVGQAVFAGVPSLVSSASIFGGAPGGTSFSQTPGNLLNLFSAASNWRVGHGSMGLNPAIQGAIEHSRARLLAEPTLVTVSGERAAFLAGGEIPILQQLATAGSAVQSVTYEPYGMRINMIPILQENGTINIEVSPEERILSAANALVFSGSSTPIDGFTTRKTQTIVELRPGQELFLSGLITTNSGREVNRTPILGEIPVLGALYRSKAFSKNESELVISIRPEIILPGSPGQLKLPEEIGRVEGVRDTNLFSVEPTVIDERHYTTGRAERQQKTSPTLPEGSPIPDYQ